MSRYRYLKTTKAVRDVLDRIERELVIVANIPEEKRKRAQQIIAAECDRVRRELDLSDLRVGIRPALKAVK